jgi:SAM-dependent methyltransferase
MNYGYAGLESELNPLRLIAGDEAERYCVQLYHYAAAPIDLRDKDVVEVSCGRGGGSSYVKRYLNAKSVTGIDLSANQIEFCRRVHKVPGLRFVQGAAEDIPLPDECFDAIINIEASCLYQDTAKFFKEVSRHPVCIRIPPSSLKRSSGFFAQAATSFMPTSIEPATLTICLPNWTDRA